MILKLLQQISIIMQIVPLLLVVNFNIYITAKFVDNLSINRDWDCSSNNIPPIWLKPWCMWMREITLPRSTYNHGLSFGVSTPRSRFVQWLSEMGLTKVDERKYICDEQVSCGNQTPAYRSLYLELLGWLCLPGAGGRCWFCLLNCIFLVTCFLPAQSIYGSNGEWVTAVWAVFVELRSPNECECRSDKSSLSCCWGECLMMTAVVVQVLLTVNIFESIRSAPML